MLAITICAMTIYAITIWASTIQAKTIQAKTIQGMTIYTHCQTVQVQGTENVVCKIKAGDIGVLYTSHETPSVPEVYRWCIMLSMSPALILYTSFACVVNLTAF